MVASNFALENLQVQQCRLKGVDVSAAWGMETVALQCENGAGMCCSCWDYWGCVQCLGMKGFVVVIGLGPVAVYLVASIQKA